MGSCRRPCILFSGFELYPTAFSRFTLPHYEPWLPFSSSVYLLDSIMAASEKVKTPPPPYVEEACRPVPAGPVSVARFGEGGTRGWMVVLGAFLNFCGGFGEP